MNADRRLSTYDQKFAVVLIWLKVYVLYVWLHSNELPMSVLYAELL